MKTKRHYEYGNAKFMRVGTMICCACGKRIKEGLYRYHETADAFVPCHRACCEDDPAWERLDREDAEQKRLRAMYCDDALAFYTKWGSVDDADFMDAVREAKHGGDV